VLIFKGSKSLILISKLIRKISKQPTHNLVRDPTLKVYFEIIPDINIIWHQFVEYSLKDRVQVNGRDTGSKPVRARSGVGIYIYFIFFFTNLQIERFLYKRM